MEVDANDRRLLTFFENCWNDMTRLEVSVNQKKTRACRNMISNRRCHFGARCNFSHHPSRLFAEREDPEFWMGDISFQKWWLKFPDIRYENYARVRIDIIEHRHHHSLENKIAEYKVLRESILGERQSGARDLLTQFAGQGNSSLVSFDELYRPNSISVFEFVDKVENHIFEVIYPRPNSNPEPKEVLVDRLLQITDGRGVLSHVRYIDFIIHGWNKRNNSLGVSVQAFLDHQSMLLDLCRGFEKRIFNDSRAYNGVTGPMTDALRACYFCLYSHLLDNDVECNGKIDFKILISLLFSIRFDVSRNQFAMPPSEFHALQNIVHRLKARYPQHDFQNEWWKMIEDAMIDIFDNILPTWEFWQNNPGKRDSVLLSTRLRSTYLFYHGIWETHPPYMTEVNENFDVDRTYCLKRIEFLREFFQDPLSKSID